MKAEEDLNNKTIILMTMGKKRSIVDFIIIGVSALGVFFILVIKRQNIGLVLLLISLLISLWRTPIYNLLKRFGM